MEIVFVIFHHFGNFPTLCISRILYLKKKKQYNKTARHFLKMTLFRYCSEKLLLIVDHQTRFHQFWYLNCDFADYRLFPISRIRVRPLLVGRPEIVLQLARIHPQIHFIYSNNNIFTNSTNINTTMVFLYHVVVYVHYSMRMFKSTRNESQKMVSRRGDIF